MIRTLKAELIKLKYQPIYWLMFGAVFSIVVLVFFVHYNDVEAITTIGENPWEKVWNATLGILSIFMTIPFLVLLIGSVIFIENHNNTWKYQYTVPFTRSTLVGYKLLAVLVVILAVYLSLVTITLFASYFLNYLMPEIEFAYYPLKLTSFVKGISTTFINSLGIIGLQLYLSLRFRGFLLPVTVGIVCFILAFIIGVSNTPISHYFPYCYPLIGQDFNMFTIDRIGITDFGIFNSVQIYSVVVFIFFVGLSLYGEKRRII